MATLVTTAHEVMNIFHVSEKAKSKHAMWANNARRKETVVPHVMAHRTEVVYQLKPETLGEACSTRKRVEHALGEVKREDVEGIECMKDWDPDYAFTHTFHYALETLRVLPTWQQFRAFCEHDDKARRMLWEPAQEKITRETGRQLSKEQAHDAMQWRVGNAYYSSVREIHLITCLRAKGLDFRVHPLADALFRVDAWWGRIVLSLYMGNREFRQGDQDGRKDRPEEILADAHPRFTFEKIELSPADRFGVVHLASDEQINRTADRLKRRHGQAS